jgi:hypothetical protein
VTAAQIQISDERAASSPSGGLRRPDGGAGGGCATEGETGVLVLIGMTFRAPQACVALAAVE